MFHFEIGSSSSGGGVAALTPGREPEMPPPDMGELADSPNMMQSIETEEDEEPTGFVYEAPKFASTRETDVHKIAQRQKQIAMGKNTVGYANYISAVSKHARVLGDPKHPQTPKVQKVMSKRCFDGQVRAWRRALHLWDVQPGEESKLQVTPRAKPAKRAKERFTSESPPVLVQATPTDAAVTPTASKTLFDEFDDDEL